MRKDDIKKSFDNIVPDDGSIQRMLNKVVNSTDNMKGLNHMKMLKLRKAVPVFAATIVIAGGVLIYGVISNNQTNKEQNLLGGSKNTGTEDIVSDSIGFDNRESLGEGSKDMAAAPLQNQFQINNKHYILLSEEQKKEFKFPEQIIEKDLGDKFATISKTPDASLMGLDVYKYIPAGGEAVLAVKKGNEYTLYRFLNFESYINNQDEDAGAYLKLYGINNASDISKIQFVGYSEQAKIENRVDVISEITDSEKIKTFYNFYSAIKNSSDKYFNKLRDFKPIYDTGNSPVVDEPQAPDYVNKSNSSSGQVKPNTVVTPREAEAADSIISSEISVGSTSQAGAPTKSIAGIASPSGSADSVETTSQTRVPGKPPVKASSPVSAGSTVSSSGETSISGSAGSATSSSGGASIPGSTGSAGNALSNSVTIRIYNTKGVYFDTVYYPNMGFISRHEVQDEFAKFLGNYL